LENSTPKSFASELREEWSEPVDECIGLYASVRLRTIELGSGSLTFVSTLLLG